MALKTYPVTVRLWHWLNALSILGLLGTVFLRKTFLSYKTNAAILVEELAKLNVNISIEQAKAIAKIIRAPMWEWHYIFGWTLVVLFIYRVILHFKDRPFFNLKEFPGLSSHHKGVQALYTLVYLLTFVMIASGVSLYFKQEIGLNSDISAKIKELHEMIMYFFAFFVPIHILAAFIAENKGEPGIVSNMISGKSDRD